MSRLVPPPRDATTVAAVRRLEAVGGGGRGRPDLRSGGAPSAFPAGTETPSDSKAFAVPSPYRAGVVVAERYQLVERLGRGGMGEVWRARHVLLHTEVALKFPSLTRGGRAAEVMLSRFRFEAQIAAHLGLACRHVAAVHDAGCDRRGPYLVMEYVRGPTLQQEIDERTVLPPLRVAEIVVQVAEALAAAHDRGVIHRDLKPSNLLLAVEAGGLLVKVADFGIAKALGPDPGVETGPDRRIPEAIADLSVLRAGKLDLPRDTTGGFMIGSPPYMSPEQMGGGVASPHGDLWSLAVIAYEALTGKLPFPGRSFGELLANQARGRFDPPSAVRAGLPAALDRWCCRALAREESRRFPTAREMADALREAVAGPPVRPGVGWAARARACLRRCAGLGGPEPGAQAFEGRATSRDLG